MFIVLRTETLGPRCFGSPRRTRRALRPRTQPRRSSPRRGRCPRASRGLRGNRGRGSQLPSRMPDALDLLDGDRRTPVGEARRAEPGERGVQIAGAQLVVEQRGAVALALVLEARDRGAAAQRARGGPTAALDVAEPDGEVIRRVPERLEIHVPSPPHGDAPCRTAAGSPPCANTPRWRASTL